MTDDAAVASQPRAHVNAASTAAAPDGKSWAGAFADLQQALASGAAEIWVAAGRYVPGDSTEATFHLRPGQALYGGFAGRETQRSARDIARYVTTLDGQGCAHHVVTGADEAVLDGFTIRGGRGTTRHETKEDTAAPGEAAAEAIHLTPASIEAGTNSDAGAGMLNFRTAPIIRDCRFEDNSAGKGGAVYNAGHSSSGADRTARAPFFIRCSFHGNAATARGGAVCNDLGVDPIFLDCVFADNRCDEKGGGMYNDFACSPLLLNCLFADNAAKSAGGLGNDGGSSPVLRNSSIIGNRATEFGAGLYLGTGPANDPLLVDCVIEGNACPWDDALIYVWHDNRPRILALTGEAGYRAGRWDETDLDRLRAELAALGPAAAPAVAMSAPSIPAPAARIVHVDAARPADGDGREWQTAYASLTAALADAGQDGAEVRVAEGRYRPGEDRDAAFVLRPGLHVLGGYRDGVRDPIAHPSVLDGDGAYHVVVGADGAVLDGFTITGGRADGEGYRGKGGGLVNYRDAPQAAPFSPVATGCSPVVRNCRFIGNSARDGGAVYSYDRAAPIFEACAFIANRAENGGAVLDRVGVTSVFRDCRFEENQARWRGGAVYLDYGSRAEFSDCRFLRNGTKGHGGALFGVSRASQLEYTAAKLTSCALEGNSAAGDGGAIDATDNTRITLAQCQFADNAAGGRGDEIACDDSSSVSRGA